MTIPESLNVVTLIMCVVTLTIASLALIPQIKLGLTILRDSVLWAVLFGIVIAVGVMGWMRLVEAQQRPSSEGIADEPFGDFQNLTSENRPAFISDLYPALRPGGNPDSMGRGYTSFDRRRNVPRRGLDWP